MTRIFLPAALTVVMAAPPIASAQQYNQPWTFGQQNRAQLAVVMSQMEDGGSSSLSSSSTA